MSQPMPNKEIIDATQDAVLNAASTVAGALESTAHELGAHGAEPFYLHAEFWVGAAFVLAVFGLAKPVGSALSKLLRGRGEAIAKRIQDAVSLKEEAQKLLADYERKFRGAEKEANDILSRSEREIELIKKETLAKLDAEMEIKEKEAKIRLKTAESDAAKEIANKTADVTLAVVKKVLEDSLDEAALDKLIDSSIEQFKKIA